MAMPPPVDTSTNRHVSPDGRTIVEMTSDFHPADAHQIRELRFPRVIDAASGATVLDLTRRATSFALRWEDDGALMLISKGSPFPGPEADALKVMIAIAAGRFATSADGWSPRPLGDAQAHVEALVERTERSTRALAAARARPTVGARLVLAAKAAGWLALLGTTVWVIGWL